jgi:Na+-driven multidrug efflux pump
MSKPSYRALRVALRIFSVLLAIGGLCMLFGSRELVLRVFLHPPEAEVSTLLLFLLKEMGGMVLMVSAILFRAARDPERNIAVVDGLIVGLVILTVTPLLSAYTLDIQRIYPGHLVWGRSVVRLALAALFFYLRPRGAQWQPAGHF